MLVMKTMYLGQQIHLIGDWLKFTYTENPGMAFGITFGPRGLVTVFSVIATFLITLYLFKVRKGYFPYRASLAFILGGAIGNIIDRVFYGAVFGGDSLFVGRVVDFIHVNIWSGFIPESLPVLGGTYLSLFPIWNVADMAIVCGVVGILYFQKKYHLSEYYGSDDFSEAPFVDPGFESNESAATAYVESTLPEGDALGRSLPISTTSDAEPDPLMAERDVPSDASDGSELQEGSTEVPADQDIRKDSDAAA